MISRATLLAALLLGPLAFAQPVDDVAAVRAEFEYGRFDDALVHAQARIDQGELSPEQLAELHKLAGLSAFNLGKQADAERHLLALIRLNPDFILDPFAVPPPAMKFFDKLKLSHAEELEQIRQARRTEQLQREAERREEARRKEEEQRRRLEELSRRVTLRTVEKKSYLVNFLPFGLGQFQQGRNGTGIVIAVAEGALLTTAAVSYFVFHSFEQHQQLQITDYRDPDLTVTGPVIVDWVYVPARYEAPARNWRTAHYVSLYAAAGVYALGGDRRPLPPPRRGDHHHHRGARARRQPGRRSSSTAPSPRAPSSLRSPAEASPGSTSASDVPPESFRDASAHPPHSRRPDPHGDPGQAADLGRPRRRQRRPARRPRGPRERVPHPPRRQDVDRGHRRPPVLREREEEARAPARALRRDPRRRQRAVVRARARAGAR